MHFNDPAFREDALRGIGNTARRIDDMIARLSALRDRPTLSPAKADLNEVVSDALDRVRRIPNVQLTRAFQPAAWNPRGPRANSECRDQPGAQRARRTQARTVASRCAPSIVTGASSCPSRITAVAWSEAFVKDSLFRPFQSTKKKGLGIGLFQSRAIVQAHGGAIHVQTEVGRGTTFLVSLPVAAEK